MVEKTSHGVEDRSSSFLLLMLAVAVSNVLGRGSYLLLAVGAAYFLLHYYSMKVPDAVVPLLVFSCIYCLFSITSQGIVNAAQIFICPLLWLVGYNLPEAKRISGVFTLVAVLAAGQTAHGLLNYGYNILENVSMGSATKLDIWTGEIQAATGQAAQFTMFLASFFWLTAVQERRWLRVGAVAVFLCTLLYAVQLGSRSFLVLAVLSAGTGILLSWLRRNPLGMKLLLWMLLGAAVILVLYSRNIWGLRTYMEGSFLYRRNSLGQNFSAMLTDGRFHLKKVYLENLLRYPWGGNVIRERIAGGYAHDLWLDTFGEAGLPALAVLLVYTAAAFFRIVRAGKLCTVSSNEQTALMCYGVVIFAQFCAEPIWQGCPMLLYSFVLTDGMLVRLISVSSAGAQKPA
ncbi:MAG: hypothetical protein J6J12_00630 [Oscillospiraceae bacterium]|nr:hypothetical protein [Oscillospiraceae bacterium]